MELYPDSKTENVDVTINVSEITDKNFISRNPSVFAKYKDGFLTHFPPCQVLWKYNAVAQTLDVTLLLLKSSSKAKAKYSRIRSMEYASDLEAFEQILHELVLVPSVYFFPDLSIVHAAALSINGKATLIAGTGGTGKTSALLALRKNSNVGFITDDIAVISKDGMVYPNLAWPKIYGYNLSSYIQRNEVLKNRTFFDRLHFNVKLKINPRTVRRKLRPDLLYETVNLKPVLIEKIVYLIRDNSEAINVRKLLPATAVDMGLHVMKTEYGIFHNHLEWDSYNSLAMNEKPLLQLEQVFQNWKSNLGAVFNQAQIQSLHIPSSEKHEDYLAYINKFLVDS